MLFVVSNYMHHECAFSTLLFIVIKSYVQVTLLNISQNDFRDITNEKTFATSEMHILIIIIILYAKSYRLLSEDIQLLSVLSTTYQKSMNRKSFLNYGCQLKWLSLLKNKSMGLLLAHKQLQSILH